MFNVHQKVSNPAISVIKTVARRMLCLGQFRSSTSLAAKLQIVDDTDINDQGLDRAKMNLFGLKFHQ